MGAAECRQKVIQSIIVAQVDDGKLCAPSILVALEQIVISPGNVEEMPRRNARWIVIVILRIGRRHAGQA